MTALLLTWIGATTQAAECRGVSFAEHAKVGRTELTLNGLGLQKATFLKIDVYVTALYVSTPSADPAPLINADTAQQLIVHFLRNVSVEHIRDQWTKDFSHVVPGRPASLMLRVATLNSWLSDVRRDERLMFIRQPGEGLQVIVDGIAKGTIPGDDFSRTFMAIWLGSAPPSAELRRGLLGGKCD